MSFDLQHLRRCDELVILTLDGWRENEGVQAEIRLAHELGEPIRHVGAEQSPRCLTLACDAKGGKRW
jgi:hypothetical protein